MCDKPKEMSVKRIVRNSRNLEKLNESPSKRNLHTLVVFTVLFARVF